MSFQDVGRTTKKRQPNRGGFGSAPSSGNRVDTVVGGDNNNSNNNNNATGYEQLSDLIVQYQVSENYLFISKMLLSNAVFSLTTHNTLTRCFA